MCIRDRVDSNIQREEILPSEKAFAYKMKLDAMKHQGKKIDIDEEETSTPVVAKLRTDEILGEEVGESRENIRRYIRLTKLIPELLEEVDNLSLIHIQMCIRDRGRAVDRLMGRINIEDNESMYYFQKCLKNMGIEDKLKKLGVCEGDTVKISDWELEWYE